MGSPHADRRQPAEHCQALAGLHGHLTGSRVALRVHAIDEPFDPGRLITSDQGDGGNQGLG
ncbi:hypothetical protein ABZY83_12105 [Streptomyces virginiae]|uniref:hypothetical protein n=1 Tax=Streptomyces TaxID=1883 RepID=UPI00131BDC24|nr:MULTISPECIES: hypothetical protein [unclassified Streptomyces]